MDVLHLRLRSEEESMCQSQRLPASLRRPNKASPRLIGCRPGQPAMQMDSCGCKIRKRERSDGAKRGE